MVEVGDIDGIRGHEGDIAVVEVNDPAGMGDQGRRIRGDEAFAFADANDERAAFTRYNEATGFVGGDDGDTVGTFDLPKGADDGLT
jgi:hypothetical protein